MHDHKAMHDYNTLEHVAKELKDAGRFDQAIRIYLFMAEGDRSLDGGHLGWALGHCYERLGQLDAARYWYGRAVEENPEIKVYVEHRRRLGGIDIDDLVGDREPRPLSEIVAEMEAAARERDSPPSTEEI